MANRITTGKKDREKVKQNKRQEKQKRKDERLKSGSRSFEEMLAYVDENGVLHSTPENIRPREEVDASEIEISIPKQEKTEEPLPLNGIVEHFNTSRGYGFIKNMDRNEKYFFHINNAPAGIAEGDKVTFEIERGERGMNAVQISIIK